MGDLNTLPMPGNVLGYMLQPAKKTKKKFRFYSAGMISILLLPLLLLSSIKSDPRLKKQYVLEINMHHPSFLFQPPLHRNEFIINLTGDSIHDLHSLYIGQLAMRKMMLKRDTTINIHFVFSEKSAYNEFVQVINLCYEEHVGNFAPYENNIWVYNPYREKRKIVHHNGKEEFYPGFICGTRETHIDNSKNRPNAQNVLITRRLILPGICFLLLIMFFVRRVKTQSSANL